MSPLIKTPLSVMQTMLMPLIVKKINKTVNRSERMIISVETTHFQTVNMLDVNVHLSPLSLMYSE